MILVKLKVKIDFPARNMQQLTLYKQLKKFMLDQ